MNQKHLLDKCSADFSSGVFHTEDDIKLRFFSDVVQPILRVVNPEQQFLYKSEHHLLTGGRPDAVFQNVSFEFKKFGYFKSQRGKEEALYGRDDKDHGLYDYILTNADLSEKDTKETLVKKILGGIGVGFDGKTFLFARFVPSISEHDLAIKGGSPLPWPLPVDFIYEEKTLDRGLRHLLLLLKQQTRIALTKDNLLNVFSPGNPFVRKGILSLYQAAKQHISGTSPNSRVQVLYGEWNRIFGVIYGDDNTATDFTSVTPAIRELYGIDPNIKIDSKLYLFSLQTFFNIFLKLLVHTFLSTKIEPTFSPKQSLSKEEIISLFEGTATPIRVVSNFFETHFLEWFTFLEEPVEVDVVNGLLERIDQFDLSTFDLCPERIQDSLEDIYMSLIPKKMRHLMGEYFSPDWIVEHVLDMAGVDGDPSKSLIDPACGSGSFLVHALKRVTSRIGERGSPFSQDDLDSITERIVGFDINPISVVAAKANYILVLFSAYFSSGNTTPPSQPVEIPVFIADSVLTPVVYTEENGALLYLETVVGRFAVPKFSSYRSGSVFLSALGRYIEKGYSVDTLCAQEIKKRTIAKSQIPAVKSLFNRLRILHRSGKDSFWPTVLRNSFAPALLGTKFDFVVGNPPWIAWKAMSKNYREGTLAIWKSYGIFEKNAYDKKTTHDDFGMAVTYVAVDQYLKDRGVLAFLLPASFLKSAKGGEGFRKFRITRKGQDMPFRVKEVHDFSDVNLFSIKTIAITFEKGYEMKYPFHGYRCYVQQGKRTAFDSHATWNEVAKYLSTEDLLAFPVDNRNVQSSWLTLHVQEQAFSNAVLDRSVQRHYTGRKGIEPAGAKGIYLLTTPVPLPSDHSLVRITNDIRRSRREDIVAKGAFSGIVEDVFVFPMLGGRNITKWKVKSCSFMMVPHTAQFKYGVPEAMLASEAPFTLEWLQHFHDELLETRIKDAKFFNPNVHPFYRLDNVGPYTFSPFKVLWKEQSGSMSAVVVGSYRASVPDPVHGLFPEDKPIVVDSKVLLLGLDNEEEAHYVCGIINAPCVSHVIDGYAISTNRGVDVLKNVAIPRFDPTDLIHVRISEISKAIHTVAKNRNPEDDDIHDMECSLDETVRKLFLSRRGPRPAR